MDVAMFGAQWSVKEGKETARRIQFRLFSLLYNLLRYRTLLFFRPFLQRQMRKVGWPG